MLEKCELLRFRESVISTSTIFNIYPALMKKLPYLFVLLLVLSCGSLDKILNSGIVNATNYKEVIPFNYDNNFALVDVSINGKTYKFLVDTGAPTCISSAIYEDLNIERADYILVQDSQGQTNGQDVVILPEIKLGKLTYNNVGAVVVDLSDVFEFKCMGIDGIIGANQMAKSYWKFDYDKKEITITDQLSSYDLSSYTDTLSFVVSEQKTPYIKGHVNGKKTLFTYDTGFAGHIDINKNIDTFENAAGFTNYGNSSLGLYDAIDSTSYRTIKVDSVRIGNVAMGSQVVDLDHGSLIGNDFMNKHEVVLDWTSQKMYLKKLKEFEKATSSAFGFKFRVKENKAVVTGLIKEIPLELKIGDVILSINDFNLRDLTDENACEKYGAVSYENLEELEVLYLRDDKEFMTTIKRTVLIE